VDYDFNDLVIIVIADEYLPDPKASIDFNADSSTRAIASEYLPGFKARLNFDPSISLTGGGSPTVIINSSLNRGLEKVT